MPGKLIATYLVRVTLRAPEDHPEEEPVEAPTLQEIETFIQDAITPDGGGLTVNASAERVDR